MINKKSVIGKLLVFAFFLAIIPFTSCESEGPIYLDPSKNVRSESLNNPDFKIVIIDSCEYVLYDCQKTKDYSGAWTSGITHKGNCKFCKNRL